MDGRAEAELIADMFERHYDLPRSRLILESRSANCGENAAFALEVARERGLRPETVALMQDSSMQRRMEASFRKAWQGTGTRFYGYAAHVPEVESVGGSLRYAGERPWGMWPLPRFLTLILGEIPRLQDAPGGYGPRGRGFIAHLDIPESILESFSRLSTAYPGFVRGVVPEAPPPDPCQRN